MTFFFKFSWAILPYKPRHIQEMYYAPPPLLLFGFIYLFIYYYEDIFLRDFLKAAGTTEEKWKILTSGLWDFVIQVK